MEPISTIIIGQFAVAGAGMYLDSRNSDERIRNAREHLFSGIHEDLINSVEISAAIEQEWQQHGQVERATLNKLKRCALTYRHNQDLIELLYEHERGEHIFNHFHEIIELIAEMIHDQGCLDDIEEAINEKLYRLRMDDPEISADQAVNAVVSAFDKEHKEYYNGLRDNMDASIKRLMELTHQATALDRELH